MNLSYAILFCCAANLAGQDVLGRTRAGYGALKTYSDTGTVTVEMKSAGAPMLVEKYRFQTAYKAPRQFYFEFNKDDKAGPYRLVVWGDGESFHRWWSTTGIEEDYPRGQGATAFVNSLYPTKNSIMQIPPLLFSKAGLLGTITNFVDGEAAGAEAIGGRKCTKFSGISRDVYSATGKEVNIRRTTIWIDDATGLIRQVLEDTPKGTVAGSVHRVTTTFDPKPNSALDDARFRFAAPSAQQ
jgi:outer membrane lipoprotein-sorting protein